MHHHIFLFYLHLPKCAGMSLLDYLRKQVDESCIYQSTSIIQNYWHNKCEYLFMPSPKEIRVYFGHWLHAEMLKQTDWRVPYLATSIREPISRFRSQYRYNSKIAIENGFEIEPRDLFLERNSNVYSRYLTLTFPTLVNENENTADSCIRILQCFDFLYDSIESDKKIPLLASRIGLNNQEIPNKVNSSEDISPDTPFSEEEILEANKIDIEIYKAFSEAKNISPAADNPLYSSASRDALDNYLRTPYDEKRVFDYLTPPLIEEYKKFGVLNDFSKRLDIFLSRFKLGPLE